MRRHGSADLAADLCGSLSLPLVVAPMFLVSTVDMVVEAGRAGVMGSIPALNARTPAIFADWVADIKTRLAGVQAIAPWAVNLIVPKTNVRLGDVLVICVDAKVPAIIASVGSPVDIIERSEEHTSELQSLMR